MIIESIEKKLKNLNPFLRLIARIFTYGGVAVGALIVGAVLWVSLLGISILKQISVGFSSFKQKTSTPVTH